MITMTKAIVLLTLFTSLHLHYVHSTTDETPRRLRFNRRLTGKFQAGDEEETEEFTSGVRPKLETLQRMDPRRAWNKLKTATSESVISKLEDLEFMNLNKNRNLWFNWGSSNNEFNDYSDPYNVASLADTSITYDNWAQAYRMLGGYIDCDRSKGQQGNSHSGSNDNNAEQGCARWMVWAAYIDPYYSGGEYDEYHQDDNNSEDKRKRRLNEYEAYDGEAASSNFYGNLNCHEKGTHWELLGVYRQEFYQFIEQISKHLWAINEYEYITTVAALAYMTDDDCFQVGNSDDGSAIYAGVQPLSGGDFQMRLYLDDQCLYSKDSELGLTYGDFANIDYEPPYDDDAGYSYTWYTEAQEYTLTNVNNIFDTYRKCTSCMDYPTYQDGYFIGDSGTDEGDLINQCWKFHSHDSFVCDSNCLELANAQGSIKFVQYNGAVYGGSSSTRAYSVEQEDSPSGSSSVEANIFLTLSSVLFVACFLSYSLARNSTKRKKRRKGETSSKSRRLLDKGLKRTSSRSQSRSRSFSNLTSKSKSFDKTLQSNDPKAHRSDRVRRTRSHREGGNQDERLPRRKHSSTQLPSYEPPNLSRKESQRVRSSSNGRDIRKSRSRRSTSSKRDSN